MTIFKVIAIHLLLLGIGGVTTCTDGWLPFEGSCYLFGKKAIDFTEAEHFCRQQNKSHLIHVDNLRENEFIKDHLHQLYHWFPGQDHTQTEDCAIFWQQVSFKWADYSCLGLFYPICEARGTMCRPQFELVG